MWVFSRCFSSCGVFPVVGVVQMTKTRRERRLSRVSACPFVLRFGYGFPAFGNIGWPQVSLRMKTLQRLRDAYCAESAHMGVCLAKQFTCGKSSLAQFLRLLSSASATPYASAAIGGLQDVLAFEPRRPASEIADCAVLSKKIMRCATFCGRDVAGRFVVQVKGIAVRGESSLSRWPADRLQ